MKVKFLRVLALSIILGLLVTSSLGTALSQIVTDAKKGDNPQNYEAEYAFGIYHGHFKSEHTVSVSVQASLYEYYERKGHFLTGDGDYARFVTPEAFSTVAQNIRKTINDEEYGDEQFANAVLDFVQQIPYVKSSIKYPVEALVENSGDCDVLSLLAASIMKAGGLDVALLYYKGLNPSHMNVGVYLPYKPVYRSWWLTPAGFEYNNKTYWMAECTPKKSWRVGDMPELLENAKPAIITLYATEKASPATIASSLDGQLKRTSISAAVSLKNSSLEGEERLLEIFGEINPALTGRNITMYIGRDGLAYEKYQTVADNLGKYSFIWNFTLAGKYTVMTSVSGAADYAGSDSEKLVILAGVYEPILDEYLMGWESQAPFANIGGQGPKYVLKSNVTGTGLSLTGEFMIISETDTGTPTVEVKIPQIERMVYFPRTRQTMKVIISEEQVVSMPVESSQLGFILRQDGLEDYTASIGVLENQQLSQISKVLRDSRAAYLNASDVAPRNKWYRIEATMSKNSTNAKLFEMNNTLLQNIAASGYDETGEVGILMSYPPNSILAFKNLKVATLGEKANPLPYYEERVEKGQIGLLDPYIAGAILLAIGFVAAYCVIRKKRIRTSIT